MSSTVENSTLCRGNDGQNRKQGEPSTTVFPRPRATAAIPSDELMGGVG